jgi:hypothetical protein
MVETLAKVYGTAADSVEKAIIEAARIDRRKKVGK